jgi:3-hydroxyacyl-CoA dehydrogenase
MSQIKKIAVIGTGVIGAGWIIDVWHITKLFMLSIRYKIKKKFNS